MRRPRRNHTAAFKAKVVIAALKGDETCGDALEEAIMKYGKPEIMNIDQGSQFTRSAFIGLLQEHSIQVSMGGKGCSRVPQLIR